jgi:hypothetical protein
MKIQPVITWQNGQSKEANNFDLSSSADNFLDAASFSYQLQNVTETIIPATETEPEQILIYTDILVIGNLSITGQDYQDWDASPSANQWAYDWAAGKLNLVLIPETV